MPSRIALSCISLLYLLLAYLTWFVCDDAFISYAYGKNLAAGHGFRFNLGEGLPVEGYSNFLWVCLSGLSEFLGIPSYRSLPALSLFTGLLLIISVFKTSYRLSSESLCMAIFATSTVALFPPFIVWSTGGLATVPFALLIFLTTSLLFFKRREGDTVLASIFASLAVLMRAEGFIWIIGITFLYLLFGKKEGEEKSSIFRFFLLPSFTTVLFFLHRYYYFNSWFPNTAKVKVGGALGLERGLDYVIHFFLTFPGWIVYLFFAISLFVWGSNNTRFLLGIVFGALGYSIGAGGDFMTMGRFLLPMVPFSSFIFVLCYQNCSNQNSKKIVSLLVICSLVVNLLPYFNLHVVPKTVRSTFHFRHNTEIFRSEREQLEFMRNNSKIWREGAKAIESVTKPGETLVARTIGNLGYFTDLVIYDQYGLVDREVASLPSRDEFRSPGHDKLVPVEYFLPKQPDYLYALYAPEKGNKRAKKALKTARREWRDNPKFSGYSPELRKVEGGNLPEGEVLFLKKSL